ncbi:MAG TPA: multicopper oxidase domain-containing protein [Anaerolineales bacterium]|nr:multicopper oxidase domain-containing protein [Anaerolineales bacterium]HNO32040.1 multicopper oxidase domain-containing protein [Anaerolineales bacterium]
MRKHSPLKLSKLAIVLMIAVVILAATPSQSQKAAAQGPQNDGMVCTTGPSFSLTSHSGYIGTPDGNVVYMWGLSSGADDFQYPGPVLCVNQGDTVTIVLHNTLNRAISLIFPGQDNVLADGQPDGPVFSGTTLSSLAKTAAANNGAVTYSFVANRPGTFVYQSGTDPAIQVPMGLFGAIVVRPASHSNWMFDRAETAFNPDREYIALLSEIDPILSQRMESGLSFNSRNYHPRYWMINGRGFPDTIAPNYASWLPGQPYGALAIIEPWHETDNPLPAAIRYLSVGSMDYPFHPHGNNVRIVGRDGMPLEGAALEDLAYDKYSIPVGPGQTWDALFTWHDPEAYNSNSNPVTVTFPNIMDMFFGPFFSGAPYLGEQGAIPVGTTSQNQCGEYYHIAHNHALYQITSWGVPMTGMATYTRINPPGGCQ